MKRSASPVPAAKRARPDAPPPTPREVWDAAQPRVAEACRVRCAGMLAHVDVLASQRAHKAALAAKGYLFGVYATDRSLFEKLDRVVFQDACAADAGARVLAQVQNVLRQVNAGSEPREDSFNLLVMMEPQYLAPLCDLVDLLTHARARADDLDLFWELTDRLWCFGHPVYDLSSELLDETCAKITARLAAVREE